jgi:hypothetical protein
LGAGGIFVFAREQTAGSFGSIANSSNGKYNRNGKSKSNDEIQGSLHCGGKVRRLRSR